MIEVEGINVSLRRENQKKISGTERQQVLSDVFSHVEEGEYLEILGESGGRKNTLGRAPCGLLKPDKGSVHPGGSRLYGGKKNRDKTVMSVVFQDYTTSVNPRFGVRGLTAEPLTAREKREKIKMDMERELEHPLGLAGLDMGYKDCFPHELSGGQLQRIHIARAIAVNSRIILFGEAISSLDTHTQVQVMDLLKEIQRKRNLTYVFIIHDLTSVTYTYHNMSFLYQGGAAEVQEVDYISQVEYSYVKKPLNPIVEFDDRGIISREEKERRIWEKAV